MKKNFLFRHPWVVVLVSLGFNVIATAQTVDWAVPCGSGPGDGWGPRKIVVDGQGNTYVAGLFNDTTAFGSTTLIAQRCNNPGRDYQGDVFVAKLDPQGRYLWASRAGGLLYERWAAWPWTRRAMPMLRAASRATA